MARPPKEKVHVGEELTVRIGAMVHGGHCLAHPKGNTAFVRHALPGELARIRITEVRSKFLRADAVEILEASEHRVEPPCPHAHPAGCGGCDLQHVGLGQQRALKGAIARESLIRHANVDPGELVAVSLGEPEGLRWRTRVRWSVDRDGHAGLLAARSHGVLAIDDCLIASPGVHQAQVTRRSWPGVASIQVTEGSQGHVSVWADDSLVSGTQRVQQLVGHRAWELDGDDFWQVHPNAAASIVAHVLAAGEPAAGEHWLDLYAGAGLISAFLAEQVGPDGRVQGVEGFAGAVEDGRRALADLAQVELIAADVDSWPLPPVVDGIVLDPPRKGAGPGVMAKVAAAGPRVVVYVACDPVAFARDAAVLLERGYALDAFCVLDAFPMTQHMECVARLVKGDQGRRGPVQAIQANPLPWGVVERQGHS